jgi:phosphoglycerate kinase
MRTVADFDFKNIKAIVRVDFNVPLNDQLQVTDDTRIKRAIPTIQKILKDGGCVILMSHLGRPKGNERKFSLKPVVSVLKHYLNREIQFADDCIGPDAELTARSLRPGQVLLLENLRFHPEEKTGDVLFAKALASLAVVYVNDAFGTAHRAHASTKVIAKYFSKDHKMAGLLMAAEVANGKKVLHEAEKPFTAILGGAKVSDKIGIIIQLLKRVDHIIIGGGMAYTFIKVMGGEIGSSLVETDKLDMAREILVEATRNDVSIHLPVDSVIADRFAEDANTEMVNSREITNGWMGLDIGTETISDFHEAILKSQTILWNGPMGVFEMPAFANGTRQIAMSVVAATKNGAYSLIGGGDSVAAVNQLNIANQLSYVSTGGGAMLEMLEGKTLPGVAALEQ